MVPQTPPSSSPRLILAAASLAIVFLVLGTIGGLIFSGAANPLVLADPGPFVRWGLPVVRGMTDLATAVAIGALAMTAFATAKGTWQQRRLLDLAGISAAIWAGAGTLTTVMTYLSVTGTGFSGTKTFGDGLWLFVSSINLGQNLSLNVLAGAVVAILAFSVSGTVASLFVAVLAMLGLVPLAISGHASGTQGHSMAVNALGLHLVGVSVWVGGLVAAWAIRSKDAEANQVVTRRYSSLALFAYFVVAASGIGAASVRILNPAEILTPYGELILAKSAILLVVGALGAYYRLRLLPKTGQSRGFNRLIGLEVALMGMAMGLATALAHTAPPANNVDLSNPTPAQILTGEKLPPELTSARWLTEWKPDLIWLTIGVFGIVLYLVGFWRLQRRGDSWSLARTLSWIGGMLLLIWITSGSMNVYEEYLFSVHMIAHMMLTMAVPLLLVPGAPVTLISRAVQKRTDDTRGVREWVLWAVHTPYARFVSNPLFAALNFATSLVIFYYTPLFSLATRNHLGHEWMIVHFLITGYLFVQALVGIDPGPKPINFPVRLMILIGTLTFHALFGLSLMMGDGLLLADWFGAMGRTWGQTPIADQQNGGAIAWGVGEFPAAILTIMVSVQWANSDAREARRKDRASDRSGGADLEAYNQMLAANAAKRAAEVERREAVTAARQAQQDRQYETGGHTESGEAGE